LLQENTIAIIGMLTDQVRGRPLASRQLMVKFVFDSYAEIQSARFVATLLVSLFVSSGLSLFTLVVSTPRLLTLAAAKALDHGESARAEIGVIKVVGATAVRAFPCL
jgi:acyl-CoA dehydrogenase